MGKIFIIVGKSATGKDTIYQRIVQDMSIELGEIVMYTTRPIRDMEQNGREYFFVSENEYMELKTCGKVIEERAYDTVYGVWRYFTVNDDKINLECKNYIMTGTLETYKKIREFFGEEYVLPIYIDVETGERLERALGREKKQSTPKYVEMCRRFIADETDFSEANIEDAGIRNRYMNDNLEDCILKIKNDIMELLKKL